MQTPSENASFDEMVIETLRQSVDYREYEQAFKEATGLPLSIEPASHLTLALCTKHQTRTSFCSLMTQSGHNCQTCQALHRGIELEMGISDQDSTERAAAEGTAFTPKNPQSVDAVSTAFGDAPRTFECFAGLCETMVPIKAGVRLVGFLKTGQIMVKQPSKNSFREAMAKLSETQSEANIEALETAYFDTPILPPQQYRGMTTLLKTYARQLSEVSQRIVFEQSNAEPEPIRKAKAFLAEKYREPVDLEDTAKAAGVSPFHFSKRFKESTGIGFVEYLARLRLESVKKLLWDPNKRITEAAFESGFQSMASFNRIWRKYETDSPRAYQRGLKSSQESSAAASSSPK